MNLVKFKKIILASLIFIFFLSSFTYLVREKKYLKNKIKNIINAKSHTHNYDKNSEHKYWAKKILSGGYILFFRHAERDKWIDVHVYDALESEPKGKDPNTFRFAENEYFKNAVCLNKRGEIQAKAMGEVIKYSQLPVGYIVSSPSCRARQTADLVFDGYDELEKKLVHKGPYSDVGDRSGHLEKYILNIPRTKDKNVIILAHNNIIGKDLFPKAKPLAEGGFHVLSINKNKLYIEHTFYNFNLFSKQFFIRNHN